MIASEGLRKGVRSACRSWSVTGSLPGSTPWPLPQGSDVDELSVVRVWLGCRSEHLSKQHSMRPRGR